MYEGSSCKAVIYLCRGELQGGDLRNALTSEGEERVTWWNKGKQIACDVARGLAFLHSNKIIHRESPQLDEFCHQPANRMTCVVTA